MRIAFPPQDRFADFNRLLHFQLQAGHRSFALFQDRLWDELKAGNMAKEYRITPLAVFHDFTLSEISFASGRKDTSTADLNK